MADLPFSDFLLLFRLLLYLLFLLSLFRLLFLLFSATSASVLASDFLAGEMPPL